MDSGRTAKRLGELLMERGVLTPAQLELSLADQRATKEFLGAILVRRQLVKPDMLLAVLSEQSGIPSERLVPEGVDWALVKQFPASALSEGKCLPIRADAESVTVAIANPLDVGALSAIENAAGFRTVKPVLVLEEDLYRVQQAYRHRSLRKITSQLDSHGSDQTS